MDHYGDIMLSLKTFLWEIIINAQTIPLSDFGVEEIISKGYVAYKIWASEKASQTTVLEQINQESSSRLISEIKLRAAPRKIKCTSNIEENGS